MGSYYDYIIRWHVESQLANSTFFKRILSSSIPVDTLDAIGYNTDGCITGGVNEAGY